MRKKVQIVIILLSVISLFSTVSGATTWSQGISSYGTIEYSSGALQVHNWLLAWGGVSWSYLQSCLSKINYTFVVLDSPKDWSVGGGGPTSTTTAALCNNITSTFLSTRIFPFCDIYTAYNAGYIDTNPSDPTYIGAYIVNQYNNYRTAYGYTGMMWDDWYVLSWDQCATLAAWVKQRMPSGDVLIVPGDYIGDPSNPMIGANNDDTGIWYCLHGYGMPAWQYMSWTGATRFADEVSYIGSKGLIAIPFQSDDRTGDTLAWCTYVLAQYLCGLNSNNGVFSWDDIWTASKGYYPVMNTNVGAPLETYRLVGDIAYRNFTRVNVQVNLDTYIGTITSIS
jgi:hypothetical protein